MVGYGNVNWYLLYAKPTERQTDVTLMTESFLAQKRWISAEKGKELAKICMYIIIR